MDVSAASLNDALVNLATGMASNQVQSEIATAVLKQIQDQQKAQAQALINMINQAPSLEGTGQILDVSA